MPGDGIAMLLPAAKIPPPGSNETLLFLKPILTPEALRIVQTDPILLVDTVVWLLMIILLCVVCWYISFVTGKAYKKPKPNNKGGAGGGKSRLDSKLPSVGLPSLNTKAAVGKITGKIPFLKK